MHSVICIDVGVITLISNTDKIEKRLHCSTGMHMYIRTSISHDRRALLPERATFLVSFQSYEVSYALKQDRRPTSGSTAYDQSD